MNSMNDQRFFDLAMKVIAREATDAERADLRALMAQEPNFQAEFERLEADVRLAKEVVPLINACTASTGEFPAYARERLQTTVRQTFGRPKFPEKEASRRWWPVLAMSVMQRRASATEKAPRRNWHWVAGLVIAPAVVVLLALLVFRTPNAPVIQLAILDTGGGTRGADITGLVTPEAGKSEVATLEETWKGIPVQNFSSLSELQAWEENWPTDGGRPAARIVYDRAGEEVRVSGRSQGRVFQKTFPVEIDLATSLQQAKAFIREQTKR
jgi:hypothetical protein